MQPVSDCLKKEKEKSMAHLIHPQNTVSILKKYNFQFQKRFGQNFLIDAHVMGKILASCGVSENDLVLEIGPGIGTMTQFLCERARFVAAVEIDTHLIPILQETLGGYGNVEVIQGDILDIDINRLVQEKNNGGHIKIVANLPYYITTPILMGLFEQHVPADSITVMVQKEVAERMKAGPGTKDYGALSLAVQYYADPSVVAYVPPNCFMPRPKVGSAVVQLDCRKEPAVQVKEEAFLFAIIRASFNQRRKTLANGLANCPQLLLTKGQIQEGIERLGVPITVRGESLTLEQFALLADILSEYHSHFS